MGKLGAALLALLIAGCVTTQPATVTSRANPIPTVGPARIVVVAAPNLPIDERRAAEEEMAVTLSGQNRQAIPSLRLFSPDHHYSTEQVRQVLVDARADALLVFRGRAAERNITVAGWRYIQSETYKTKQAFGPGVLEITTVHASSGARPYTYDLHLFHAAAPEAVWEAEVVVQGGSGVSFRDLAERAARDGAARLVADKGL